MTKTQTMHFGSILTAVLLVLIVTSCATAKNPKMSADHIEITEAYVQQHIPGQQDALPSTYLFVHIDILDSTIVIDSAEYHSYIVPASTVRLPLKISWSKGRRIQESELNNSQAYIYYTKGKKHYKSLVDSIITKKDLYLP